MERSILHVDCNKFYASVECLYRPELRDKPVAVAGSPERRHGIILTKNEIAAKFNIKTGEAIWQAKQKCPELIIVPPNYTRYLRFSRLAAKIYADYTDVIEPFGLDESWLDVTNSGIFGSGTEIAEKIRQRVKSELGITVSVGVSFNKIFAKLGSDYKKPDAVTVITRENFRKLLWGLPASDMLFVGRSTDAKLRSVGIKTIGDLANAGEEYLIKLFGKMGEVLFANANGLDCEPVVPQGERAMIKSISNSSTPPRNLENDSDVKLMLYVLCESVTRRMRSQGFKCRCVTLSVRDEKLAVYTKRITLPHYTSVTSEISENAVELFLQSYTWKCPVRSIGVSCSDFEHESSAFQLDMFVDAGKAEKLERLDKTTDSLKRRFGKGCIKQAALLRDEGLGFNEYMESNINPFGQNKV